MLGQLDQWTSPESGAILHLNDVKIKTLNKFPHGAVSLEIQLSHTRGTIKDTQGNLYNPEMNIYISEFNVEYAGIPIMEGTTNYHDFLPVNSKIPTIKSIAPIEALTFIESQRNNDVSLTGFVTLVCRENENFNNGQSWVVQFVVDFIFTLKYSENEWIKFLSEIGYNDKWIVEIDRPKIEGLDVVFEHIRKAQEALYDKKESEDVLRDLRSARDSFEVFYKSNEDKIAEIIDRGSQGEDSQPAKSKRIRNIYDKIGSLLNIGPHNDKYEVSYADAQLAFREFVSILSYLSHILNQVGS